MYRRLNAVWPLWILSFAVAFSACRPSDDAASTVRAEERVPVSWATAQRQEVVESVRGESTLQPFTQIRVVAESAGRVEQLSVEAGDTVRKGELLARLENKDLLLQIAHAQDTARLQQKELEAATPLYQDGFLSRQNYEQLELSAAQARNQLARLRTQQSEQTVRAPIDGVVLQREIERGQQVALGGALFVLADLQDMRVRIPVPERSLRVLREGQAVELELSALDVRGVPAVVERILPTIDAASGTAEIDIRLLQQRLEDGTPILPGMYVRAQIEVKRRDGVLVVPRQALIDEGGEQSLFVVKLDATSDDQEEGTALFGHVEQRLVQTGWEGDGLVEILDGLDDEDAFVRVGQNRLRHGSLVRVVGDRL